jgi:hypothetical protein
MCTTATTSCEITGLSNGTAYTVAVTVTNAAGRTGPAGISNAFVPAPQVVPPGKVRGFSRGDYVKVGKRFNVVVRWKAPRDDGGAPIIRYRVRIGTDGRWSSWSGVTRTAVLATKLKKRTKYTVQVRAVNSAGRGQSAAYSFTTPRR